jgi:hypothetical protein
LWGFTTARADEGNSASSARYLLTVARRRDGQSVRRAAGIREIHRGIRIVGPSDFGAFTVGLTLACSCACA